MTKTEYEKCRARIEDRYRQDMAALDRVQALFCDDEEQPARRSEAPTRRTSAKKLSRSEAMKASWIRRRAGKLNGDEKGLSKKAFNRFLVADPLGENGDK